MLKFTLPVNSPRMRPLAVTLGLVCLLLWAGHSQAGRFEKRGLAIPDAPNMFVQGATRLDRIDSGAELAVPLDSVEAWQLLNRVLAGLGIKPKEQDVQRQRLFTGWILWVWDPDSETGRSKPPLEVLSRTYERHRFELSVSPDAANTGALIHISDAVRQREVDITPDSGYSWLQWQDAPVQADAAWSFMRRLQGNFESALSSRLMPSTAAAPRIIEPVRSPGPGREATPVTPLVPATADVSTAVIVEPARTLSTPVPPQAVEQTPTISEISRNAAIPPPASSDIPPVSRSGAVQGGLLVDGGLDATWQALRVAIEALGVGLQSSDQTQHMLTTQWIAARYDKKNQQFVLESKAKERWAFNLWGKGRQRHRFQLILIPVDGGARTMVYAYHTGFQVETDQTPDSSQTLLYWKDKKTDPAIAMAFLRRLRLVVRP
ncbi:MAG: hypothetical protein BMS9Abin09_0879 [Gammaproteobacteria bacterium]|nr:MAG: hypothetical protein BMS9Abin09_0879 [Gammaproteobacteria bacterium]